VFLSHLCLVIFEFIKGFIFRFKQINYCIPRYVVNECDKISGSRMSTCIQGTTNVWMHYAQNVNVLLPPSLGKLWRYCFPIMQSLHMWNFLTSNAPNHVDIFCSCCILLSLIWPNLWCHSSTFVKLVVIGKVKGIVTCFWIVTPSLYKSLSIVPSTFILIWPLATTNYLVENKFS
jgi:hypothetical protein